MASRDPDTDDNETYTYESTDTDDIGFVEVTKANKKAQANPRKKVVATYRGASPSIATAMPLIATRTGVSETVFPSLPPPAPPVAAIHHSEPSRLSKTLRVISIVGTGMTPKQKRAKTTREQPVIDKSNDSDSSPNPDDNNSLPPAPAFPGTGFLPPECSQFEPIRAGVQECTDGRTEQLVTPSPRTARVPTMRSKPLEYYCDVKNLDRKHSMNGIAFDEPTDMVSQEEDDRFHTEIALKNLSKSRFDGRVLDPALVRKLKKEGDL